MISAILIDDVLDESLLESTISGLRSQAAVGDIIVATERISADEESGVRSVRHESIMKAFIEAIESCATERLIIISSALTINREDLAAFIEQVDTASGPEHLFIPFSAEGGMSEIPSFSPETLIENARRAIAWPLLAVATTRAQLMLPALQTSTSATEFLARALITAYSQGDAVDPFNGTASVASEGIADALCGLDDPQIGRLLQTAVDIFNIEELFPALSWRDHSSESAAAAYHSLAALFIRASDLESANQCLNLSEQLEESPRFFALKGLIAKAQGETLGAVANMVSSLQCYEARKKQTNEHYLSFQPSDLDDINSQLVEGLNALNRRDNETALTHFSRAVFQFDPFYVELGVRARSS